MNNIQKKESKKIKYLLKNWWMAEGESYKRLRRFYRRLSKNGIQY